MYDQANAFYGVGNTVSALAFYPMKYKHLISINSVHPTRHLIVSYRDLPSHMKRCMHRFSALKE